MNKIIEDLSTITTLPLSLLKNLCTKTIYCICHKVYENIVRKENLICVDIGIGKLYIELTNSLIHYKFVPSKFFEDNLIWTINNNKSPLVKLSEEKLEEKIKDTYKELL